MEGRGQDTLLPRSTLRNSFAGFLFIFNHFAPTPNIIKQHAKGGTAVPMVSFDPETAPESTHNNQPDLHNNNNNNNNSSSNNKKREKEPWR
jgi:hypothetical protein